MPEVIGFLREDKATFGEKEVLKRLEAGLPSDFYVYVECPICTEKIQRFPDFIVVSNFGVVVLEVKDWLQVIEFDKYNVKVFQKGGKQRIEKNPTISVREIAIALNDQLKAIPELLDQKRQKSNVPWGYAVIFPHLPTSIISQMRSLWGASSVLNLSDLEPYLVTQRLKATVPVEFDAQSGRALSRPRIYQSRSDGHRYGRAERAWIVQARNYPGSCPGKPCNRAYQAD